MASALELLDKGFEELLDDTGGGAPQPGSEAQAELDNAETGTDGLHWGPDPVSTTHVLAQIRLAAASDQVRGTGKLAASSEGGLFSPWAPGRAALEAAGVAYWLLEPNIGARERVARGLTDLMRSIRGARRFASKAGVDFDFDARFDDAATTAAHLGLTITGEGWGRYVGSDDLPSKTELVEAISGPDNEGIYSIFSGFAHGEAWALFETLRYSPDVKDPSGLGRTLRQPSLPMSYFAYLTAMTASGFGRVVERAGAYYGWSSSRWQKRSDESAALLRKWARDS